MFSNRIDKRLVGQYIALSRRGDVPNGEIPKAKPIFILSFLKVPFMGHLFLLPLI